MSEQTSPTIRLNVVGRVQGGRYDGWYLVVLPKAAPEAADSYTVYICTDTTFAFAPEVRECYNTWLPNYDSLEYHIAQHFPAVEWDESIPPPRFTSNPRTMNLAARFRARAQGSQANQENQEDQTDQEE
ncbi:MAG: hypothetical protein DYG88_10490 [Chloroflexi bacterium CFX4]|nr:hypothetical protein [Chloroflexi bacterium CFX4]MDL1923307.1 hypothetical protein [Chloroflexi bacterium CFX3]